MTITDKTRRKWIAVGGRLKDLPMLERLVNLYRRKLPTPRAWYEARHGEALNMYKQLNRWKPSPSKDHLLDTLDKLMKTPKYEYDVIRVLDLHNLSPHRGVVTEAEADTYYAVLNRWRKKMFYSMIYRDRERTVPFWEYGGPPGTGPKARRRLLGMLAPLTTPRVRAWLRQHGLPPSLILPKQT